MSLVNVERHYSKSLYASRPSISGSLRRTHNCSTTGNTAILWIEDVWCYDLPTLRARKMSLISQLYEAFGLPVPGDRIATDDSVGEPRLRLDPANKRVFVRDNDDHEWELRDGRKTSRRLNTPVDLGDPTADNREFHPYQHSALPRRYQFRDGEYHGFEINVILGQLCAAKPFGKPNIIPGRGRPFEF